MEKLAERPKKKNLVDFTKKYNDLSVKCQSRNPFFLSLEELMLVMDWKLQRGKFRPQLKSLIESNSPDLVVSVTKNALSKEWPENLKILTELRGVGPATATGIFIFI